MRLSVARVDPKSVHLSCHKCLNVDFRRVMHRVLGSDRYRHFSGDLERFIAESGQLEFASVANHALPLKDLPPDVTVSRFIRDSRDLIVSGYFYRQRALDQGGAARFSLFEP